VAWALASSTLRSYVWEFAEMGAQLPIICYFSPPTFLSPEELEEARRHADEIGMPDEPLE
jgi:hypothetical protein